MVPTRGPQVSSGPATGTGLAPWGLNAGPPQGLSPHLACSLSASSTIILLLRGRVCMEGPVLSLSLLVAEASVSLALSLGQGLCRTMVAMRACATVSVHDRMFRGHEKGEVQPFATTGTELEGVVLSESCPSEKVPRALAHVEFRKQTSEGEKETC